MPAVSIRVEKIRTRTEAGGATRHGRRGRGVKHVDKAKSIYNVHWKVTVDGKIVRVTEAIDVGQSLEDRAKELNAKFRANGALGTEALIWTGTGYLSNRTDADRRTATLFAYDAIKAMVRKFGVRVVGARLDLDERSPHVSVFLVPIYVKEHGGDIRKSRGKTYAVSHNSLFGGGRDGMSRLQDWIAEAMQAAGHALERGRPKSETGATHGDQRLYRHLEDQIEALTRQNNILRAIIAREIPLERMQQMIMENLRDQSDDGGAGLLFDPGDVYSIGDMDLKMR